MHHLVRPLVFISVLAACGEGSSAPMPPAPPPPPPTAPSSLTVEAGNLQTGVTAMALPIDPTVLVRDGAGAPLPGVVVQFTVAAGGGWTVSDAVLTGSTGRASTTWYLGPVAGASQTLSVSVGGLTAGLTAVANTLLSGATYYGHNQYIEFQAGDGPFILSAPHGGALTPVEIPDRTVGTLVTDSNTDPMIRALGAAILAESGRRPHLIISRLRRTKLDPNREVVEAAAGHPAAVRAWREYHGFIEAASAAAAAANARAFYLDVHGHGHATPRLEWGYLLPATTLDRSDAELDAGGFADQSSVRSLAAVAPEPFASLLRGSASLGARFEAAGYPSVPSPTSPSPGTADYFNGGYSTARHGSRDGGSVSGVQLEMHFAGVRDTETNRLAFAAVAARVLVGWLGMFP